MTYVPLDPAPRAGVVRRFLDRLEARRRAARRRADVGRRRALVARVWAIQIAATTLHANKRSEQP